MQALNRKTDIAPVPRQYRNRPTPPSFSAISGEPIGEVIHLVGDDPALHEQLSRCPSIAGTKVLGFSSGNEYLGYASKNAASCVLIDSNLPDMCGLELQCRLASTSNPSVIFISNRPDVSLIVCAMKAGAIGFFCKPFEFSALMAAILEGLANHRRFRQRKAESAKLQARFNLLTPREREVLPLVIGGLLNKQAASLLGISEVTLQIHRSQVMRKMEADSIAELVRMAIKLRIPHWREQRNMSSGTELTSVSAR